MYNSFHLSYHQKTSMAKHESTLFPKVTTYPPGLQGHGWKFIHDTRCYYLHAILATETEK